MSTKQCTIKDIIAVDLGALAEHNADKNRQLVDALATGIIGSGIFEPAPEEPINEDDLVIGEMTPRQKALHCIFQNQENEIGIREHAYNLALQEIGEDPRILKKKGSGKNGLGMCQGFMLVLY